jgi:hypothetical protein
MVSFLHPVKRTLGHCRADHVPALLGREEGPVAASAHLVLGTVPDWIAAIGTALALFVAVAVFSLDLRERHRRQASQVAAWLQRGDVDVTLHVVNSSDVPVYKVRVTPQFLGRDYEDVPYPLLEPHKDDTPLTIPLPGNQQLSNNFLGVQMLFADSGGRRWKRSRDGKLRRKWRDYQ